MRCRWRETNSGRRRSVLGRRLTRQYMPGSFKRDSSRRHKKEHNAFTWCLELDDEVATPNRRFGNCVNRFSLYRSVLHFSEPQRHYCAFIFYRKPARATFFIPVTDTAREMCVD